MTGRVSALALDISFLPLAAGAIVEPGLVISGVGLSSWWANDNSELAISVILMLAPVIARLTHYWWLSLDQPSPVALPLSFGGVGVSLRWGRQFAAEEFSTVA
jgi:hypothetical protein